MEIITNNVPRLLKYGYEVPEKLRADFDYIEPDEFDLHGFIEYRGEWYDGSQFMRVEKDTGSPFVGWHGITADTFFSGVLIRYIDDDLAIIGRYYS